MRPAGRSARRDWAADARMPWTGTAARLVIGRTSVPALASTASLPCAVQRRDGRHARVEAVGLAAAPVNCTSCACGMPTLDAAVRTFAIRGVVRVRDDHVVRVVAPEQEHAPRSPCSRSTPGLRRCSRPRWQRFPARAPAVSAPVEVRNLRRCGLHVSAAPGSRRTRPSGRRPYGHGWSAPLRWASHSS